MQYFGLKICESIIIHGYTFDTLVTEHAFKVSTIIVGICECDVTN